MGDVCRYKNLDELKKAMEEQQVSLPLSSHWDVLGQGLTIGTTRLENRLCIQPMEGCDGNLDGSPGELTWRRYERFAESGAALIWVEACAVREDGRANPRQLMLTEANLPAYQRLVAMIHERAAALNLPRPILLLQATHSGRYSKPDGVARPRIAQHNTCLEPKPLDETAILSDEELDRLIPCYAKTAQLAFEAGFDGIDIKACHRYLINELLAAHRRPGRYGGSLENRSRFLREAMMAARAATPSHFLMTARMNVYDGYPYPEGWGTSPEGADALSPDGLAKMDLSEPILLIQQLQQDCGLQLLNETLGNPYNNPHVNRPFSQGPYEAPEHPLKGVQRHVLAAKALHEALPDLPLMLSGVSWLRGFSADLAAGVVEQQVADLVGFGRLSFSNPHFARDILKKGELDPQSTCLACSQCSQLMRAGSTAGCVPRDREVYGPIYKRDVIENEQDVRHMVSNV